MRAYRCCAAGRGAIPRQSPGSNTGNNPRWVPRASGNSRSVALSKFLEENRPRPILPFRWEPGPSGPLALSKHEGVRAAERALSLSVLRELECPRPFVTLVEANTSSRRRGSRRLRAGAQGQALAAVGSAADHDGKGGGGKRALGKSLAPPAPIRRRFLGMRRMGNVAQAAEKRFHSPENQVMESGRDAPIELSPE
jgi:hypothetical protein